MADDSTAVMNSLFKTLTAASGRITLNPFALQKEELLMDFIAVSFVVDDIKR